MRIETERLLIRSIVREDETDYFEIFGNPAISKYDDFLPCDPAEAKADIIRILTNYALNSTEQEYAVELKNAHKVIGVLSFHLKDGFTYIGYHFNESYHGKGYATESLWGFLPWLIDTLHLEIRAVVDPENEASIHVLEKLGFQFFKSQQEGSKTKPVKHELVFRLPTHAEVYINRKRSMKGAQV